MSKDDLPESCQFRVFGGGGEAERNTKMQKRFSAIQQCIQIDALKVQNGLGTPMNYERVQKYILKEGGINDTEQFFTGGSEGATPGTPPGSQIPGTAGQPAGGLASTALQALAYGQ